MPIITTCPFCSTELDVADEDGDVVVQCPSCEGEFLPSPDAIGEPLDGAEGDKDLLCEGRPCWQVGYV